MTVDEIITHYGLFAVFAGSGLEGEPFAIAGGVLAHRGLVPLWQAIVAASIGSSVIDQFWFFLGRHFRTHKWVVSISKRPAFAEAINLIERRPRLFILSFRFAYGLRVIAPVAMGTSNVPTSRFVVLNLIAATLWGSIFVALGYAFGNTLERWLPHSTSTVVLILVMVLAISILGTRVALRKGKSDPEKTLGTEPE